MKRAFALLLGLLLTPAQATAAPPSDENWVKCGKAAAEVRPENCTAIIESQQATPADRAAALGIRGVTYSEAGDYEKAVADFSAGIRLKPDSDLLEGMLVGRGYAYFLRGENDRAITDETEALRIKPGDAAAMRDLADALSGKGDYAAAVARYTQALKTEPGIKNVANNRGYAFLKLGRFDEAIADYDTALGQTPENPQALYGRGLARRAKGDGDGAQTDIAAAEKLAPGIGKAFGQ